MRFTLDDYKIRFFLSADPGDGGGGSSVGPTSSTSDASPETNPEPSASSAPPTATAPAAPVPQQQQGPDYSGLAKYGDPETVQRIAEWYQRDFMQKYQDPIQQQKFDQWYQGQQQQQQHPYDWMSADEKRIAEVRQQGEQHPDFPRYQAEFSNFFHNQPGHLANLINHPKVAEAAWGALAPQVQDLAKRMMEQEMAPIKQYLQQQGEQQFRQQYESAWATLPDHIKQAAQQNRFGDWNQNRHQAIINAVEFGKSLPKAQPAVDPAAPVAAATKPAEKPEPTSNKASNTNGKRWTRDDDSFVKEYGEALSKKK